MTIISNGRQYLKTDGKKLLLVLKTLKKLSDIFNEFDNFLDQIRF